LNINPGFKCAFQIQPILRRYSMEQVKMGKTKLALLQTLMTDLKDECDMNNYYLTRLVREVKREINIRISARKESRQKHWKKAKNIVRMVGAFGGGK
jgi:hypothetical protein